MASLALNRGPLKFLELRGRVMSLGQFLRGFEDWMVDLADNHAFVDALLEQTTDVRQARTRNVRIEVGADHLRGLTERPVDLKLVITDVGLDIAETEPGAQSLEPARCAIRFGGKLDAEECPQDGTVRPSE